ncbi:MAG: hypothetical protein ACJ72Z_10195 [Pyrinomonadaceae bacterium]
MEDGAAKPYHLSFEQRPEYLYAFVDGERDSYLISHAYWIEVAEECEKRQTKRVLVDENISEAVSVTEMYQIASEIPDMFAGIAIAFVDRYADQAEINEFGEMVAQNRGVVGRFFKNVESAEKWLLEQK